MAERNSFKLLAEEQERLHVPPPEIEEHIFSNIHILSLMGKSMELFIPGAINLFIQILGGTPKLLDNNDALELGKATFKKDADDAAPGDAGD